jgi:aspartate racemase
MLFSEHIEMRHIGIVAGSAEGAAFCYRTICRKAQAFLGPHAHPEITMHTFSLRSYLDAIDRDDWASVAALMSQSAVKLAQAGADLVICPNNTLHRAFDLVESPIPWLHIAKAVAEEASHRRFRRVGLLGTQIVTDGSLYALKLQKFNIDSVIAEVSDRIRIQHIIRTELIAGHFTTKSRIFLKEVITKMKANGAEAIILGCTELPLLISDEQSPLPLLDSTRLLAQAALTYAISSERQPMAQGPAASMPHHVSPTL